MKKTLIIILLTFTCINLYGNDLEIKQAFIQSSNLVEIQYSGNLPENLNSSIKIEPHNPLVYIEGRGGELILKTENDFKLDEHYYIKIGNTEKTFLIPEGILDSLY
ncbi:MAG: hypothetical protein KAR38_06190, partial [Calditrichia bacterium]|nr:hypothetical protein [Calditrichia bacterium]